MGVLQSNNLLENPEKLFLGKIYAPETLISRNGAIFASLDNGDVIKIEGEKFTVVGKFGKLCCELCFGCHLQFMKNQNFYRRRQ